MVRTLLSRDVPHLSSMAELHLREVPQHCYTFRWPSYAKDLGETLDAPLPMARASRSTYQARLYTNYDGIT